jgi:hypothetical protein
MTQFNFDMSPTLYPNGANQAAVNFGQYFEVATKVGSLASSVPAGMLINDVAVDPDSGDAYFTDSFNCREF